MARFHTDRWLLCPRPRPTARAGVVCLPFAGGGAGAYRGWADRMPPWLDLAAVRLPGREARLAEAPLADIAAMAAAAVEHVGGQLAAPVALFGHSLGALVAYEMARLMALRGRAPAHLFVSASPAPTRLPRERRLSHLSDAALRAEIGAIGGTPADVLASDELWSLVAPTLRADFAAHERYRWRPGPPLRCPITILGGDRDPHVGADDLRPWADLTSADSRLVVLPGDHFYAFADPGPVLAAIADDLAIGLRIAA